MIIPRTLYAGPTTRSRYERVVNLVGIVRLPRQAGQWVGFDLGAIKHLPETFGAGADRRSTVAHERMFACGVAGVVLLAHCPEKQADDEHCQYGDNCDDHYILLRSNGRYCNLL